MNLPSTRSALATGLLCALLVTAASAATPVLTIQNTKLNVGKRISGASAVLNQHVYFAGGHIGLTTAVSNVVSDINLQANTVGTLPPLPTARAGLGLVAFLDIQNGSRNALMAVGGLDANGQVLGTVELFDTNTGVWTALPSLNVPRAYLAVVAGTNNFIYAIGGVDSTGHSVATVEAYSLVNNSWTVVGSLNTPRSHFAALLGIPNTIYAAGGIDENGNILSTTEVYALASNGPWTPWVSMNVARSDFGFAPAADGFFHAFGGKTATGLTASIEGYNPFNATWTVEANSLPNPRGFLTAARGLNGNDYIFGGKRGKLVLGTVLRATPPAAPSHTFQAFLHNFDEPYINGNPAADEEIPFNNQTIQISIGGNASWSMSPAVNGTVVSGGSITVTIPTVLGLGVINGLQVSSTNLDGSNPVVLGKISSLLGLSGTVTIPIVSTPFTLKDQVLVLNLSSLLGLSLNLSNSPISMQVNGLDGTPSN